MRKWFWILCGLFACLDMHPQSAWREFPEEARVVRKRLRNTFISFLYNDEIQVERASVVNNRMLRLQLRCIPHSLEYRGEVTVEKRNLSNGRFCEFSITQPKDTLFFLPNETVQIGFDLSSFNQNGEYIFTFQLHTELEETYFVEVCLNTEEFEKQLVVELISDYPDFEKLRDDENHVYAWIEHYTEFPGGNEGLVRFLKKNIRKDHLPIDLEGYHSVGVGMIIEKDGSIFSPEIVDSNNRKLDAEAMRLVSLMPQWKPGTIEGVKVRNRVKVLIRFGHLERSCFVFDRDY